MKKRILRAVAFSTAILVSLPALAQEMERDLLSGTHVAWFRTMNLDKSGWCLSPTSSDGGGNSPLLLLPCPVNLPGAVWEWIGTDKAQDGKWITFAFRSSSGSCISVLNDSVSNGAQLVMSPCDYLNGSQLWIRASPDRDHLSVRTKWINVRSGKCMDAPNVPPDQWGFRYVGQWECAGTSVWQPQMFSAVY